MTPRLSQLKIVRRLTPMIQAAITCLTEIGSGYFVELLLLVLTIGSRDAS